MRIFSYCIFIHFFIILSIIGPDNALGKVSEDNVADILKEKAKQENKVIYFNPDWFTNVKFPESYINRNLSDILNHILPGIGFRTINFPPNYLVIVKDIQNLK